MADWLDGSLARAAPICASTGGTRAARLAPVSSGCRSSISLETLACSEAPAMTARNSESRAGPGSARFRRPKLASADPGDLRRAECDSLDQLFARSANEPRASCQTEARVADVAPCRQLAARNANSISQRATRAARLNLLICKLVRSKQ